MGLEMLHSCKQVWLRNIGFGILVMKWRRSVMFPAEIWPVACETFLCSCVCLY
ncbi:hypothetical protein NC652_021265 [Populus alba x Populus x berolinensis]|nr:hypothetical protein NC651_020440 [Populus alba x Populus x berolinensis]KAJ6910545.1 hypothetical protein NC652_021265 [Populus alba x Populus x berolinensis]KAJ6987956.1 hypothetical protein NC653_021025 [Populus alba x Populus x berolinensis]